MADKGVIVVKIGGSTLGSHDTAMEDLVALQAEGRRVVVVHGGGKTISAWLARANLESRFVRGLRVTDKDALDVVVAVLAGLVNKDLVSSLNALGGRAVGLSGADGGLLQGTIRDRELGYVGDIACVNCGILQALLSQGLMPVVASVAQSLEPSDEGVHLLNINADTAAGEVAAAIGAYSLIYLTDVKGILDGDGSLLPDLTPSEARGLIDRGVVTEGMIPKVLACLKGLEGTPLAQIIDGREPHALLRALNGEPGGTTIRRADRAEGKVP
ncbi:MAG: acetylglutamate kinase [Chloroflexi bacterium]|nr:acetylglutamate kinase [Chloroflexota bacterium]